jgi:hypothetical protein
MTKKQGQECVRVIPQDKGVLAELLNIRNSEHLGVPPGEDFVLLDHEGTQIAMVLRNRLSEEEAEGWDESRQFFHENSVGWAGGCQAAPYPKAERIISQLKSSKAATSCGIADTMVVKSVGPEKEGAATGVKVEYVNADGESKSYGIGPWVSLCLCLCSARGFHLFKIASTQFNSSSILLFNSIPPSSFFIQINRMSMGSGDFDKLPSKSSNLVESLTTIYAEALSAGYLCDRRWPDKMITTFSTTPEALDLHLSFLEVDEGRSKCGIHHDPPSPLFALVAGPTTHKRDAQTGQWQREHNGGRLFLADGVFSLEYGPRDVVVFSGNWPHGITNMKQKGTEVRTTEMMRFSCILFSRFFRGKMKHHGNYNDGYQKAWGDRCSILAGEDLGTRRSRSRRKRR